MSEEVRRLEESDVWSEIKKALEHDDIQTVADEFDIAPGAIRGAMRRQLQASRLNMVRPESPPPTVSTADTGKAKKLASIKDQLGKRPDGAIAKDVGLSMWVVRGYRIKEGIPAYSRWDDHRTASKPTSSSTPRPRNGRQSAGVQRLLQLQEHMGEVPDQVLARLSGVHVNTVRLQRRKLGISGAPPGKPNKERQAKINALLSQHQEADRAAPTPPPSPAAPAAPPAPTPSPVNGDTRYAWRIVFSAGNSETSGIAIGSSLAEVALSLERTGKRDVRTIERLDPLL